MAGQDRAGPTRIRDGERASSTPSHYLTIPNAVNNEALPEPNMLSAAA